MTRKRFFALFCALTLLAPMAEAAPSITTIVAGGPLLPGVSLTITGTSFGTKPVVAPVKWDNFEGGTLGSDVANGWTKDAASNCSAPLHYPRYSNAAVRSNSGKSVECRFDETSDPGCSGDGAHYSSSFGVASVPNPGLPVLYMDGWCYYAPASPESRNVKLIRVHTAFNGAPNLFVNIYCAANSDGLRVDQSIGTSAKVYDDCNNHACPFAEPWHGETWWASHWRHVQLYLVQSSAGGSDGTIKMWTDGVLDPNATNWNNRSSSTSWDTAFFGNYVGHDGASPCNSASPGNTNIYWDDAYVDTTLAHVEIGDNATYASCTQREIQVPTAWSTTSITIASANRGGFSTLEGKYLFVVDRTGAVSSGVQLAAAQSGTCVTPF